MMTVRISAEVEQLGRCPKCGTTQRMRGAGPSAGGHQFYDVLSDTFGVVRCQSCGHRGRWIDFHPARGGQQEFTGGPTKAMSK